MFFNTSVCASVEADGVTVVGIPATDLAIETGHIMIASMVMLGAYATVTRLVALDSLAAAVAGALPAYRGKHVALNVAALECGAMAKAVTPGAVPAWEAVPA